MGTKTLFSHETFVHAISGAAGIVTAMTVFFPLDTIRSRVQIEDSREAKNTFLAIKELVKEEGISSLYSGLQPVLTSLCCSNFVYFYGFHGLRSLAEFNSIGKNAVRDLIVAGTAGFVNIVLTTPLWVANTRLKFQGEKISSEDRKHLENRPVYKGIIDAITQIAAKDGWASLWSGMVPSIFLISNPAIQFTVYECLKAECYKLVGAQLFLEYGSILILHYWSISQGFSNSIDISFTNCTIKVKVWLTEDEDVNHVSDLFRHIEDQWSSRLVQRDGI